MFKLAFLLALIFWHTVSYAQLSFVRVDIAIDNMQASSKRVQAHCTLSDTRATTVEPTTSTQNGRELSLTGMASAILRNGRFHGVIDVPFRIPPLQKFDQVQCELRLCASLEENAVCDQPIAGTVSGFNSYNSNAFHRLSATEQIDLNPPSASDSSPIIGLSLNRASGYVVPDRGLASLANTTSLGRTATRAGYGVIPDDTTANKEPFVSLESAIAASYTNRGLATETTTYLAVNDTLPSELLPPVLTALNVISTPTSFRWDIDHTRLNINDRERYEEYFIVGDTLVFEASIAAPAPKNGVTLTLSSTTSFINFQAETIRIPEGATSTTFQVTTAITTQGSTGWSTVDYREPKYFSLQVNLEEQVASTVVMMNYSPWFNFNYAEAVILFLKFPGTQATSVPGGHSKTVRLALDAPAPAGGAEISLQNSRPNVMQQPVTIFVPEGLRAIDFQVQTRAVTTPQVATINATFNGSSGAINLKVNTAQVNRVSFTPSSVVAGASAVGHIRLGSPAPSGGAIVTLTNNSPNNGSIPNNVSISAGQTTADFPITTFTTDGVIPFFSRSMHIEAQLGTGNVVRRVFQVKMHPNVTRVTLNIDDVEPGETMQGEVRLSGIAPPEGSVVSLSSSTPLVTTPPSVTIEHGERTASFSVSTQAVTEVTPFVIQAASHNTNKQFNFSLSPLLSALHLSSRPFIGFGDRIEGGKSIAGGILIGRIQETALTIPLKSNSTKIILPDTVTIPAGELWGYFTVSTEVVSDNHAAEISATLQGVTAKESLTLVSAEAATPAVITEITWSDEQFIGGRDSTFIGHVMLNKAAVANMSIDIAHNGAENISAPNNIFIRQGEQKASFEVAAIATEQRQDITFSVIHRSTGEHIDAVHIIPPARWMLKDIVIPRGGVVRTEEAMSEQIGTIYTNRKIARGESAVVTLTSSNPFLLSVPTSVEITNGNSAHFNLQAAPVHEVQNVTITATLDLIAKNTTILVVPESLLVLDKLSVPNNKPLVVNRQYSGSIELSRAVPFDTQEVVTLTSSHPGVIAVPDSIVIENNNTRSVFNFTPKNRASELQTVTITATLNGISISEAIEVMPAHNPE